MQRIDVKLRFTTIFRVCRDFCRVSKNTFYRRTHACSNLMKNIFCSYNTKYIFHEMYNTQYCIVQSTRHKIFFMKCDQIRVLRFFHVRLPCSHGLNNKKTKQNIFHEHVASEVVIYFCHAHMHDQTVNREEFFFHEKVFFKTLRKTLQTTNCCDT